EQGLCAAAPLLAVIHGRDSVPDLLEAGELMERLWLRLTQERLACSFFNLPVEVPDLRRKLQARLGISTPPQLLMRIGYSLGTAAPTPRRPVEEILEMDPDRAVATDSHHRGNQP
ncbi:MAG: hypothetical protein WB626_05725, partial [Bacteroidota bacterium]